MKKNSHFVVPDSIAAADLIEKIQLHFKTAVASTETYKGCYYDTFDWRLSRCGLSLYWQQGGLCLFEINESEEIASMPCSANKQPDVLKSMAAGPLRERLAPVIDMRTLLPLANPHIIKQQIHVLNRDMKIIVRLHLKTFHLNQKSADPFLTTLHVEPLRGYQKEAKKCIDLALFLGLTPSDKSSISTSIHTAFGHKPCSYSTKLDHLTLTAKQTASTAALSIFQSQLAVMKQNEHGILADIDTEFLHDFRVALRRTRAGLSEIKGIFSEDVTKRFKTDLKRLGTMTNRLRDLDVYLLMKDYYKSLLPDQLQPELEHLFKLLEKERAREQRKVQKAINSSSYRDVISAWEDFLTTFQLKKDAHGPNAQRPIKKLAKTFILKTWKKVELMGRAISKKSPDEKLHDLRLQCKKLRYLLEFFASLFPEAEMRYLVKQLKKLQENLGDFNDLCVQQETLHEYLEIQVKVNSSPINIAAAIGGLIANLNRKQQEVRAVFDTTFKQFDQPKNRDLFQTLFNK